MHRCMYVMSHTTPRMMYASRARPRCVYTHTHTHITIADRDKLTDHRATIHTHKHTLS